MGDKGHEEAIREQQGQFFEQRPTMVRGRLDQAYQDRLAGKVSEDLWKRKSAEWQIEERQILASIQSLKAAKPERLLDAARILELANKACFLYVKQPPAEKAKLLKMVPSNCEIDAVKIYPTYRKPFDPILQGVKTEVWRSQGDDFRTFLGDFVAALPQIEFPVGSSR